MFVPVSVRARACASVLSACLFVTGIDGAHVRARMLHVCACVRARKSGDRHRRRPVRFRRRPVWFRT